MGASFCGEDDEDVAKAKQDEAKYEYQKPQKNIELPLPGTSSIANTFDLDKDLELLKQRYPKQYTELLERKMIDIECSDIDCDYDINSNSMTVMQFNMLADGLCTAYFVKETEKTFLNVDKECLQWTYRGVRIAEEILRYNADIIAIEECDHIDFLMKYLSNKGYSHYFQEKETSPIRRIATEIVEERKMEKDSLKMNNDGVALIYKKDKFEVCDENDIEYVIGTQNKECVSALAVPFLVKNINKEILFIVTHLKSKKSKEGEELRVRQINSLFALLIKNEKKLPCILCCDLNSNPVQNKKGYAALCYSSITSKDNLGFDSVYKLANGDEPQYTTFKLRKHGIDKHVLDYIFVKDGKWNVTKILDIPKVNDNEETKLIPNWFYPSDHFSLLAQLTWK